ncbi:transposase, partial [Sphingomonas sp. IW22]|uniref:transposase n=1 Tax=Sphingomonas sp. IW22 TaxID=3242489 RepID=UPI00351FCB5D
PQSTVNRIIKRYNETGNFINTNRKGKCGRKRLSNKYDDRLILRASMKNPRLTAVDIKKEVSSHLSVHTIRRRLNDGGRFAVKPIVKPMLTSINKKKRLQWAKQHRQWTAQQWRKVIFSDESSFEIQLAHPRFVRCGSEPLSALHMVQRVKQPMKVMIWGCMSYHGFGRIHVVDGSMNTHKYIDVLNTCLIPQADQWYNEEWIFQQDNATCHTSKLSKMFMHNKGIDILPWPPCSPDMNPIETLWAVIKDKLRKLTITNKNELINKILGICHRDNEVNAKLRETCVKLVDGMPRRIDALIKGNGGHTKF